MTGARLSIQPNQLHQRPTKGSNAHRHRQEPVLQDNEIDCRRFHRKTEKDDPARAQLTKDRNPRAAMQATAIEHERAK